jgi:hypothetical protein
VVNLVAEAIAETMNKCAASLPCAENEPVPASLHAAPSTVVKPLRTLEAPVSLECKAWGKSLLACQLIAGHGGSNPHTPAVRHFRFEMILRILQNHYFG